MASLPYQGSAYKKIHSQSVEVVLTDSTEKLDQASRSKTEACTEVP